MNWLIWFKTIFTHTISTLTEIGLIISTISIYSCLMKEMEEKTIEDDKENKADVEAGKEVVYEDLENNEIRARRRSGKQVWINFI